MSFPLGARLTRTCACYANSLTNKKKRYINFAHGDEELSAIYGSSLDRLRTLKQQYDPTGVFNQWFQIK